MHLVINLKEYTRSTGNNAVNLSRQLAKIRTKHKIIICPQIADLKPVAKSTKLTVFSQHLTKVSAASVKQTGAKGTLLNHSEHKLSFDALKRSVKLARSAGLKIIICAATSDEAKKIAELKPDFVAIEPPDLIGGNISVSTAKPELITDTLKQIKNIPVLCGAGIKKKSDVAKAVKLGVRGILVASGVVLSKNPKKKVEELLKGFE